jgi:hypothetical protein
MAIPSLSPPATSERLRYALWSEALDRHLADLGERRLSQLGVADPAVLAALLPAFADVTTEAAPGDRHRTHRGLRDLLERLAAVRPLVVWIDRSCPNAERVLLGRRT